MNNVINEVYMFSSNYEFSEKYDKIFDLTGEMMSGHGRDRPSCLDILEAKNEWALEYNEVRDELIKSIDPNVNYNVNNDFVIYFLKAKYEVNK